MARFMTCQVHEVTRNEILGADGATETITGTSIHPVWSVDRQVWVPLAELSEGETLQGSAGPAMVLSVSLSRVTQPVYNIEVHGEHVYQVGELGVVVHNSCFDDAPNNAGRHPWSPSYSEAAADSHHIIQDAAARAVPQVTGRPAYSRSRAPGIQLDGPSTEVGSPHYRATRVQDELGGGTYGAERRIGYKALRKAGKTPAEARAEIERADLYFIDELGWTKSTPTRIPGNRR